MLNLVKYAMCSVILVSSGIGVGYWYGAGKGWSRGFDDGFHGAGVFLAQKAIQDAPEPFIMVMPDEVRIECVLVPKPAPDGEDGYHPSDPSKKEAPGALVGPGNPIPDPGEAGAANPNGRFKTRS